MTTKEGPTEKSVGLFSFRVSSRKTPSPAGIHLTQSTVWLLQPLGLRQHSRIDSSTPVIGHAARVPRRTAKAQGFANPPWGET